MHLEKRKKKGGGGSIFNTLFLPPFPEVLATVRNRKLSQMNPNLIWLLV